MSDFCCRGHNARALFSFRAQIYIDIYTRWSEAVTINAPTASRWLEANVRVWRPSFPLELIEQSCWISSFSSSLFVRDSWNGKCTNCLLLVWQILEMIELTNWTVNTCTCIIFLRISGKIYISFINVVIYVSFVNLCAANSVILVIYFF